MYDKMPGRARSDRITGPRRTRGLVAMRYVQGALLRRAAHQLPRFVREAQRMAQIRTGLPGKGNQTMTPVEAIHKVCAACVGSPFEVKDCGGEKCQNGGGVPSGECWFYKFRLGKGRPSVKLINKYCRYCMGSGPDSRRLVDECFAENCVLHLYRRGTNPNISEETRQKRREVARRSGFGQKFLKEVAAVP